MLGLTMLQLQVLLATSAAVSTSAAVLTNSGTPCFRRTNVTLAACARTMPTTEGGWYTTWTVTRPRARPVVIEAHESDILHASPTASSASWVEHVGLNCFTNHAQGWKGGTSIPPEPFSRNITLMGCQEACLADALCTAIVVPTPHAQRPPHPPLSPDAKAKGLQKRVKLAIANGARSLVVPGGAYHFGSTNFQIEGAENLALLAPEPLDLWFAKPAGVNITNCKDLSLGNISINYGEVSTEVTTTAGGAQGITLNLLNSSRVSVSDVSITGAAFMVITAWNGYGDHHFTRVHFEPSLGRKCRDALHFSDQKVGPTFVDCVIGYTGDDL
eukprot:SAG11_NODE_2571_length_3211_cov_4.163239_3_plen_329_part_00